MVPKKYKKLVLNSDGTLKEVLDRCEQLGVVRGYTNEKYEQMKDEEITERLNELGDVNNPWDTPGQRLERLIKFERTRHLMVWGDGSTILNHGHLLYLIKCVYDPAFDYTSTEMKAKGHGDLDVPALVEKPHIYILGRCSAKEVEQLAYIDTRRECLDQLPNNLQTSKGTPVMDVMRFFHGDGPEQQFESGEQRGGNNGCSGCSGDSRRYCDLVYSFRSPHLSLADRCRIVRAGPAGRRKRNGGIRPFKDMTVVELRAECLARGLSDEGLKKELQQNLKDHLKGIQRVPALLVNDQDKSMEEIHLGN